MRYSLLFPLSAMTTLGFVLIAQLPAHAAADPAIECQAGKLKEASKYAGCRLKADSKAASRGTEPNFTKCDAKFGIKWQKVEDKAAGACATTGDLAAVQHQVAENAISVADKLKPLNPMRTCGLTFPQCGGSCGEGSKCLPFAECGSGQGTQCDSDAECSPFACLPAGCECQPAKRVFLTFLQYQGFGLGGVAGADAICQDMAIDAGLSGTYRAWISGDLLASSPSARFTRSDTPYVRTDGVTVADDWADLTDGTLKVPIVTTADGMGLDICGPHVWTNTRADGTPGGGSDGTSDSCGEWSVSDPGIFGHQGYAFRADSWWTQASGSARECSDRKHLYCFEQ